MPTRFRTTALSALAALSLGFAAPAPAFAWGEREQNALAAIVAAGVIGTILLNEQRRRAAPVARAPVDPLPAYAPRHRDGVGQGHPGRYGAPGGIHATPAAWAFNRYSPAQRRAIQARLAEAGYYAGAIDGTFGPMTYRAVMAIAGDSTGTAQLDTPAGAAAFYDAILG